MEIISLSPQNTESTLQRALEVLRQGGILIFPTETMYGVGVDATNEAAVTKLLAYKNRPAGKPISVLVSDTAAASKVVELNPAALSLCQSFLPGPLTVISKSRGLVDRRLESEFQTLGIRISSHPFVQKLTAAYQKPITATSANASGKARPYKIKSLIDSLSTSQNALIGLIVDAGELPRREPSTVIDTTQVVQEIVRGGAMLEQVMRSVTTTSPEETFQFAAQLMTSFLHVLSEKSLIFALEGEMGAGKTQFSKGIGRSLRVVENISSPTYTLIKEYVGMVKDQVIKFIHIDCWRVPEITAEELQLNKYMQPNTVIVIEWAAPLLPYLKPLTSSLVLQRILIKAITENERQIEFLTL